MHSSRNVSTTRAWISTKFGTPLMLTLAYLPIKFKSILNKIQEDMSDDQSKF